MFHTYYSNSYEVLKAFLLAQIRADFAIKSSDPQRFFETEKVIVPSIAVQKDLERSIASQMGICCGMEFSLMGNFLKEEAGAAFSEGVGADNLIWSVWLTLQNPDFVGRHKRLSHYLQGKDPVDAYKLARHIAAVLTKYAGYRFDWVLDWMGESIKSSSQRANEWAERRKQKETQLLETSPDYAWQRDLMRTVSQPSEAPLWPDSAALRAIPQRFDAIRSSGRPNAKEGQSLHVFVPFTLTPLALPFLRLAAEATPETDVFVYLQNPSSAYWFDSLPPTLSQWPTVKSEQDESDRIFMDYLRRNAASTRALIERLWRFANSPENELAEDDAGNPVKMPQPTRQIAIERLQDLQLGYSAQTQFVYLEPQSGSLLSKVQAGILDPSRSHELFCLPTPEHDDSLLFITANTFAREVEECLNQLHGLFSRIPDLRPEDVLIAVPDLSQQGSVVQSVMAAQNPQSTIAWQMQGQSLLEKSPAAQAVLSLGDLLIGTARYEDVLAWLSLPFASRCWGLGLDDLDAVGHWLASAGFRWGLSAQHVRSAIGQDLVTEDPTSATENSLERALERLCAGYAVANGRRMPLGDCLPVMGNEDEGFAGAANKPRAFRALNEIAERLEESRISGSEEKTAEQWGQWTTTLVENFFGSESPGNELRHFMQALQAVLSSMRLVVKEQKVPMSVFWTALKEAVGQQPSIMPAAGAVTVAAIETVRRLPFRVIFALGVNADCGFPGSNVPEEFDLTEIVPRVGDRDSRQDKRCAFLDLLLSAKDRFIVSWSEGSNPAAPINPSLVVQDLMALLHDMQVDVQAQSVRLPLAAWSQSSFLSRDDAPWSQRMGKDARWWRSTDPEICSAVSRALTGENLLAPAVFAGGVQGEPLKSDTDDGTLPWKDVSDFFFAPDKWWLRRNEVNPSAAQKSRHVGLIMDPRSDRLFVARENKEILECLESGETIENLQKDLCLDPRWGARGFREQNVEAAVAQCHAAIQTKVELSEGQAPIAVEAEVFLPLTDGSIQRVAHSGYLYGHRFITIALTNSARKKALFESLIWAQQAALDEVHVIDAAGKDEMARVPSRADAQEVMTVLVEAMRRKAVHPLTSLGPVHDSYLASNDVDDETAFLWRGARNVVVAKRARKTLQSAMDAFFDSKTRKSDLEVKNELLAAIKDWSRL